MPRLAATLIVVAAATIVAAPLPELAGTVRVGAKLQADAVVWLDVPNAPPPAAPMRAVLDQRNLMFSPHVLAVRTGTVVELPNNDLVFHNVFSFHDGKKFDLGLYPVGTTRRLTFERPGLSRLFCNIHPAMAAYIMAVDTPFFAVSDRQGRFSLRGVPASSFTWRAWRPGGEIVSGTVDTGAVASLDVTWR